MAQTVVVSITEGDTLRVPVFTLKRPDVNGNLVAINLTGLTVLFRMVGAASPYTVKILDLAATIVEAESGQVRYDWQSLDVNTHGVYYAWFIIEDGGAQEHIPTGNKLSVHIHPSDGTKIGD